MEGHTVRTFDGDILALRMRVLEMGGLAIDQVQRAVQALVQGDDEAARAVMVRDAQIADYARTIEEDTVGLVARRQPVASDLRAILTVGKVATELERVGHGARKIARLGIELHETGGDAPLQRFHHDVRKISRLALSMLRDALDCFDRVDLADAERVARRDEEIDAEFRLALRGLVTYLLEDQHYIRSIIQTVFLMKALERIGDHARSIALAVPRLVRRGEAEAAAKDEPAPGPHVTPRAQSNA